MTLWIAWSLFASVLVAIAAATVERIAANGGAPRRFVWTVSIPLAVALSLMVAMRSTPTNDVLTREGRSVATLRVPSHRGEGYSSGETAMASSAQWDVARPWSTMLRHSDALVARLWLAASTILLLGLVREALGLHRLRSRWTPENTEIGTVLVSRDVGPAVMGLFRPRIVVPRWVFAADRVTRDLVLHHELQHVRAGDTRLLFLAELAIVAFPWNAALWWMARRLTLAIEIDCDARVVRTTRDSHTYGLTLLAVAERHTIAAPLSPSLSEPRLNLEARLDAMTAPRPRRPLAASVPYAAIAVVALATTAWAPMPAPFRARHARSMVVSAPGPKPLPGNPAPRYPDRLRADGIEGGVIVEFTVDARGIPDSSTVRAVESTHELFTAAVRSVVPSWRFDGAGVVRLAFRFMTTDTEAKERAGQQPWAFASDPGPLGQIVVVTVR
jgi:TonB family protein